MELTLISFATVAEEGALREHLHELGHVIEAVPGQSWLDRRMHRPPHPAALFLGSAHFPREQLLEALAVSARPVSLGIFHRNTAPWDREVLARCTEFIGWPCPRAELALRLERLGSLVGSRKPSIDEQALLDEFAALNLIGRSPPFLAALAMIKKLARCDAPVLIQGETGTGKEMAARGVHYLSSRRDYPFIPVNCAAIPDNLVENELFGHERGAYTDAKATQSGVVAQAEKGTLFLDEIDALSTKAQAALLRFLQDRQYKPLGGAVYRKADVRVLAASNRDLAGLVGCGVFRQDLYYRLNLMRVDLPPLRDRRGDVELLAGYFLERHRAQYRQPNKYFHPSAVTWMRNYRWPGNVRELEYLVHREFLMAEDDAIVLRESAFTEAERRKNALDRRRRDIDLATGWHASKARAIAEFERSYLHALLVETSGNISQAARRAGKERRALGKLLKKYRIDAVRYGSRSR